jgi:two-component system, cell cycle response regulator CtrA
VLLNSRTRYRNGTPTSQLNERHLEQRQRTKGEQAMRILIAESDTTSALALETLLQGQGFNSIVTNLGEEAIDLAKLYDYDILLLASDLQDLSGIEVIKILRISKVNTPIIFRTPVENIELNIKSLSFGADDSISKVCDDRELVCRIHAVVRRSKGFANSIIETGPLRVNLEARHAEIYGTIINISIREYATLEILCLRKERIVTPEALIDDLYGEFLPQNVFRNVNRLVCSLRRKLREHCGELDLIHTVRERGYVLREPRKPQAGLTSDFR